MCLLFVKLHCSKTVRTLDVATRAAGFVTTKILTKDGFLAVFTIRQFKLTLLRRESRNKYEERRTVKKTLRKREKKQQRPRT
jgi:hypothetical protein